MSTSTGLCPRCNAVNAYTAPNCIECGSRLPWADALDQQRRTAAAQARQSVAQAAERQAPSATPIAPRPAMPSVQLSDGVRDRLMLAAAAIGVILVIIFFVSQSGSSGGSSSRSPSAPTFSFGTPVVTMAEYNQIQSGMSYSQVKAIIGESGEEMSRSDVAGYSTVMYAWKNNGGISNMTAMFQNDRLVSKAQLGLS